MAQGEFGQVQDQLTKKADPPANQKCKEIGSPIHIGLSSNQASILTAWAMQGIFSPCRKEVGLWRAPVATRSTRVSSSLWNWRKRRPKATSPAVAHPLAPAWTSCFSRS